MVRGARSSSSHWCVRSLHQPQMPGGSGWARREAPSPRSSWAARRGRLYARGQGDSQAWNTEWPAEDYPSGLDTEGNYRSDDGAATWRLAGAMPCLADAQVTRLEQIVSCGVISRDGLETWQPYAPPHLRGRAFADVRDARVGAFVADPPALYFTEDGGRTWAKRNEATIVPHTIAFDVNTPGRMIGLTEPYPSDSRYTFVHESQDQGRTWRYLATIDKVHQQVLHADEGGTVYTASPTALLRSSDGGSTWRSVSLPGTTDGFLARLAVDRQARGHVAALIAGPNGGLFESQDFGASWRQVPPAPGGAIAIGLGTHLYAGTTDGLFRFEPESGTWSWRANGIQAKTAYRVVAPGGGALFAKLASGVVVSHDNGKTWSALTIDGTTVERVNASPSLPSLLLAITSKGELYRSLDAGATWVIRGTGLSYPIQTATLPAGDLVPFAPEANVVAGINRFCGASFVGCMPQGRDITRSTDGGRTWVLAGSGSTYPTALFGGRADPEQLFAQGFGGDVRSPDGGEHWTAVPDRDTWLSSYVPDPIDANRWYRTRRSSVAVSHDRGDTWRDITPVYTLGTTTTGLVIDPDDTRRLFLVAGNGGVSLSEDRGVSWRVIASSESQLGVLRDSAILVKGAPDALYAAASQGVIRLKLDPIPTPSVVPAVEYRRDDNDHYFVTADPDEVLQLDRNTTLQEGTFRRTGRTFNVWPAGSVPPDGASPVCRFYGRPEKGLDSHFYSASVLECMAVQERFAASWVFEAPDVFVVGLPALETGHCRGETTPVYRLFNNRPDANHRYTTSREVREQMIAQGWISEGYGGDGVAMCAPQ